MILDIPSHHLFVLRLSAGALTVVLVAWAFWGPERKTVIHPAPTSVLNLFDDREVATGKSQGRWLDTSVFGYVCSLHAGAPHRYCGVSIKFYREAPGSAIASGNPEDYALITERDLSRYRGLILDVDYAGASPRLRLFVRNSMERDNSVGDILVQKFQYAWIYPEEFNRHKPISVDFSELTVADWWMEQFQIRRRHAEPTFDRLLEISLDLPSDAPLGEHHFVLKRVTAVGDWIPSQYLYWIISAMWILLILVEGLDRYGQLLRRAHIYRASLAVLEANNKSLLDKANRDPLTGAYNRRGIEQVIEIVSRTRKADGIALMVVDIDKFKQINDQFGHPFGDKVLAEFSALIASAIRASDKWGRWGGEEFVLLSEQPSLADAERFANKLCTLVADHPFNRESGERVRVTISIGLATLGEQEPFNHSFARADQALYTAKERGRNQVCASE